MLRRRFRLRKTPPPQENLRRLPVDEVCKEDRRSRVWIVTGQQGRRFVIKRFEHAPAVQFLTGLCGIHPAQREKRAHEALIADSHPVAPVLRYGTDFAWTGCRYWTATPFRGIALTAWIQFGGPALEPRRRHELARNAGRILGRLLVRSIYYPDFQPSNLLVEDAGPITLIDAATARMRETRVVESDEAIGLMTAFHDAVEHAFANCPFPVHVSRTDRLRFYQAMMEVWQTKDGYVQRLPKTFAV